MALATSLPPASSSGPSGKGLMRARSYLILKKIAQCMGISSLALAVNYGEFLGGGADARMHSPAPLGGICLAQSTDILLLAALLFALLMALRRTRFYSWARLVLAILIPPYLVDRSQSLFPLGFVQGLVLILAVSWAAVLLLLLLRFKVWYRRTMRVASGLCAFLALFALSSLAQLLWVGLWKPGPQVRHAAWETAPQPPRTHPRVVWIVFDELSFAQLFEHRARDLSMPAFDALARESTVFTDVQPVGHKTVKIIPSLFSGQVVDGFHFSVKNRFRVHDEGLPGSHQLTGSGTIFADAQRLGWRTAIVGWYNPYCTIYGDALDSCFWSNLDRFDGPMAPQAGFWSNVYTPLRQMVREVQSPARAAHDLCTFDVRERLKTHIDLRDHALGLLRADQADFVFLHLSIPHSPNIWSRMDDDYTDVCDSSYLDNLALVDRILGVILTELQSSPRWKDTTLIVQGDHSWRIELWDGLPAWTDEDDQASRGVFDPRPALIIHAAGQGTAKTVSAAWPLLQVHNVLEQVLAGKALNF